MKPILYLRTSTKDQNPELQKEDGIIFCLNIGLGEPEVFSEQGSAYKLERVRPIWESIIETAKKDKRDIVVWKYDRAFRNRQEFFKFMKIMFEVYKIKVYSVTEPSILKFWELLGKSNTGNPVIDELINNLFKILWDFMIQQSGEQAEEESRKKSERVKLAVRKEGDITKSYKGKKWGRKSLNKNVINQILELIKNNPKLSVREISKQVTYYDKNNNKKPVSRSAVHKILKTQNYQKGDKNTLVE